MAWRQRPSERVRGVPHRGRYESYATYTDSWEAALRGHERTLSRLHAIATRHEVSPNEPPLRQPLPRACARRVEALMEADSTVSRDEAERRVRGKNATLMSLFSAAIDAWKPLCRLAERCAAQTSGSRGPRKLVQ